MATSPSQTDNIPQDGVSQPPKQSSRSPATAHPLKKPKRQRSKPTPAARDPTPPKNIADHCQYTPPPPSPDALR